MGYEARRSASLLGRSCRSSVVHPLRSFGRYIWQQLGGKTMAMRGYYHYLVKTSQTSIGTLGFDPYQCINWRGFALRNLARSRSSARAELTDGKPYRMKGL